MTLATAQEHHAGEVLDKRYRLVERLGRGGFGEVWRADELLPDGTSFRSVALKLLVSELAESAHWAEEAKLLASFRHPSLVTVFAAGVLEGTPKQPFVAMELLIGDTLADLIARRKRIAWRRVLRWAREAAAALDLIHSHGVIHLDLKPANLFLDKDGAVKVLDFGIARRRGEAASPRPLPSAASRTETADLETAAFVAEQDAETAELPKPEGATAQRAVVGTPGFMAPEVFEMGDPTAATDAYALAVCIVQLTTGHLPHAVADQPHEGGDPKTTLAWWSEIRSATLRGELRDLSKDPAGLPRGLVDLLNRLLSVDQAQRNVTPGRLCALLDEAWQRPHGVPSPPYFGFEPATERAEGMLFGRDEEISRLGRELEFEPCVVLQGVRGSGKSSLARAGLVPHLGKSGADGKDDWKALFVRPGRDPDQALQDAMNAAFPGVALDQLLEHCSASPIGMVLVVDPLDDLPTAPADKCARLSSLLQTVGDGEIRRGFRTLCVLGEEQTSALLDTPLGAALRSSIRFVGSPMATAASDLVESPAKFAGAQLDNLDLVIADVQRELRSGDGRLPYISMALAAYWSVAESAAANTTGESNNPVYLSSKQWKELGGLEGTLAAYADHVLTRLKLEERQLAEELLLRLSQTDGTPIRWDYKELADTMGNEANTSKLILSRLEQAFIVRIEKDHVDAAHPAFVKSYPRLQSLRLAAMERLSFIERIREAAAAWNRAGEHKDFLPSGDLLNDIRDKKAWLSRGLGSIERRFVEQSLKLHRKRVALRAALGGAFVLAIAGGLFAKRVYDLRQMVADAARKAAEQRAYVAEVVAKARHTEDPYQRVAWIIEAMNAGSTDGTLPLDLSLTVANTARARFLTLDAVASPSFPWNDRWLLGGVPGPTLTIVDMSPSEPGVIENINLDEDPESATFKRFIKDPKVIPIHSPGDPIVERVPFAFDTSVVTRSSAGNVQVLRLRNDGTVALAAPAPMRCAGSIRAAERAPVIACSTEEGIVRWDLRRTGATVDRHAFRGVVLDISPDGAYVAATLARRVLLWAPEQQKEAFAESRDAVVLGRFSPRDPVFAMVQPGAVDFVHLESVSTPLFQLRSEPSPFKARWHDSGLYFSVCNEYDHGEWHYLRNGIPPDTEKIPKEDPCSPTPIKDRPVRLWQTPEIAGLTERDLGPHPIVGGFKLSNGNLLSRDLVLYGAGPAIGSLLRFQGLNSSGEPESLQDNESAKAFSRVDSTTIAFQVGEDIRLYNIETGRLAQTGKGNLIRLCEDGRLLAWKLDGDFYQFFDVRSDLNTRKIKRKPGLMLGADASCHAVLHQNLDGTIMLHNLEDDPAAAEPKVIAQADGYVFATALSPSRGNVGGGMWMALSSGALARFDDKKRTLALWGYATPRATALGDGPEAGDLAFADASGASVIKATGQQRRILEGWTGEPFSDLSTSPDGSTMLLTTGERIYVLDLNRKEIVGEMRAEGRSRLSPWDREGSVFAWTYDRVGVAEGQIFPRGLTLATRVAESASNLRVKNRKLVIKR